MRKAMINEMKYWIKNHDIDGYRCDVAGEVPLEFWKEAIPKLRKIKPIFMLAEAWEPELLKENLFDMCYGWEEHFLMVDIAKGKKNVGDFDQYLKKVDSLYEKDDIIMNFVSNHDENSWKGTLKETFGEASEIMTVLTYMIPGMPLLYSGEEYGLDHRLKFFEKDLIHKKKSKNFELYKKLGVLKNNHSALFGGKVKGEYIRIYNTKKNDILSFKRFYKNDSLFFIGNMTNKPIKFGINLKGEFTNALNHKKVKIRDKDTITLKPWKYLILK